MNPITVNRSDISSVLTDAIASSGLQLKDIAEKAGITSRHLHRARHGQADDAAIDVLRALGYHITENLTITYP